MVSLVSRLLGHGFVYKLVATPIYVLQLLGFMVVYVSRAIWAGPPWPSTAGHGVIPQGMVEVVDVGLSMCWSPSVWKWKGLRCGDFDWFFLRWGVRAFSLVFTVTPVPH